VLVETVSAGGGSIAWIDDGGALRVGPHSAGVVPGPVAFGRGGSLPTVTDAHVALKRITERRMSGGVSLDVDAARASIASLAAKLDDSEARVAKAIIATADATMARALRRVSVERGIDPRGCALIAFGGGGPLHACGLADLLGLDRVVVPPHAGVLSALGLAMTPERRERMMSVMLSLDAWTDDERVAVLEDLAAHNDSASGNARKHTWFARMRYLGQGHELDVSMTPTATRKAVADGFVSAHDARYGFRLDATIEVVSVRHVTEGPARRITLEAEKRPMTRRLVGPASLALADATLHVAKGWKARLHQTGSWLVERA